MNAFAALWRRFMDHGMGRAFRHRDFMIYCFSGEFANIGIWLQRVGVQWVAWELTHSYAWIGAIAFVDAMGILIFMPIFGTIIDRGDRLHMMRLAQAGVTGLAILLAMLTLSGLMTIWILAAMMLLHGALDGFWSPARLAMAPSLVPREELAAAIGLNATLFNLAQFVGPAIAGLIIAAFDSNQIGIGFLFVITTIGFLIYLGALFTIRLRYEERVVRAPTGLIADFREGVVYIFAHEGLALYMMLMLATALIMRPFREMLAGFADGVFRQGPEGLAILTSAVGIGALIGALVIANKGRIRGLTRIVLTVFAVAVAAQLGFVLAPSFNFAVIAAAILGVTVAMGGIGSQILVQSAIHAAMRGRVMSLWTIIMRAMPPVGAWAIGTVAEFGDFQLVFASATILYLLIFLAMAPKFRLLARTMETAPVEVKTRSVD